MRLCEATPYIKHLFEIYQNVCNQRNDLMRRADYNRDDENYEEDTRTFMWEDIVGAARDLYEAMASFLNETQYFKVSDYGSPSYLYADNVSFTMDRLDNYDLSANVNIGNSFEVITNMQGYNIPWKDEVNCSNLSASFMLNSWINIEVITQEEFEEKTIGADTLEAATAKLNTIENARKKALRSCSNIRRNNPKYQHIKHSIKQFQLYVRYLKNLKEKFDSTIYPEAFSNLLPPELVNCVNPAALEGRDCTWIDSYNSSIRQDIMNNGGMPDIDLL